MVFANKPNKYGLIIIKTTYYIVAMLAMEAPLAHSPNKSMCFGTS